MATKIFLNLPVADLPRSRAFFEHLGYAINPRFSNETSACVAISPEIHAMLLTHDRFADFTARAICDARASAEVLICLSCETRQQVDDLVGRAVAAGGAAHGAPKDHGVMYGHGFEDPDGHVWELMYLDPAHFPAT